VSAILDSAGRSILLIFETIGLRLHVNQQKEGKNLVGFGEKGRKLAKFSMTTFTYRSSS
jgi:hypothetical protein